MSAKMTVSDVLEVVYRLHEEENRARDETRRKTKEEDRKLVADIIAFMGKLHEEEGKRKFNGR